MADWLHTEVLDQWGLAIVAGRYDAGDRIAPDDEVSGVSASRTVVREAIRVLESIGMVQVRRRAGALVQPRRMWNFFAPQLIEWRLHGPERVPQFRELSELRSALEPRAAELASTHATARQLSLLSQSAVGMAANAHDAMGEAYLGHDEAFHRTLLEASGNLMFSGLANTLVSVLRGRTSLSMMPSRANERAVALHAQAASAIAAGDGTLAATHMREIVTEADAAMSRLPQDVADGGAAPA